MQRLLAISNSTYVFRNPFLCSHSVLCVRWRFWSQVLDWKRSIFLITRFNRIFYFHLVAQKQKIKCICALTHSEAIPLGSLYILFLVFSAIAFNLSVHLLNEQWNTSALLLYLPTCLPVSFLMNLFYCFICIGYKLFGARIVYIGYSLVQHLVQEGWEH